MARVSVIVATFNHQDGVVSTIRSALAQTYRDFEIVVVDDGSTDDSAVEVLRHLGPDPERAESLWRQHAASNGGPCGFGFWVDGVHLQYICQPNRGIGAARNRGIQATRGEMLAFLEMECAWDPDLLERCVEFFDSHPEAAIAHGKVLSGRPQSRSAKRRKRASSPFQFDQVVTGEELVTSAILVRRSCIETHGCFDENLPACEDYDLWVRIAAHVPIHQLPDAVVYGRAANVVPTWSLDRYRVYALEKAFQSGHLNADQRRLVAQQLVDRCGSLVDGYRKRNNLERANFYDRKKKKSEMEVAKLELSGSTTKIVGRAAIGATRLREDAFSPLGRA